MTTLRSRGNRVQKGIEQKTASLSKENQVFSERKFLFDSSADSDLLVWLKGLALDPCKSKASTPKGSFRKLWNQTVRLRKVLFLTSIECPQRKRKLQQFLNSGKFATASGLALEKFNKQNVKQLDTRNFYSKHNSVGTTEHSNMRTVLDSCNSHSSLTFEDSFQTKRLHPKFSSADNAAKLGPSNKDTYILIDTDESGHGSNILSQHNPIIQDASIVDSDGLAHSSDSSSSKRKLGQAVRFLKGEYESRPVIPVGPSFQAEVPEWTGPANQGKIYGDDDSESLKWLGTRVWPIEGKNTETIIKPIGKGRPDSCSCVFQGSAECIKHHILEASMHLQSNLGPAFSIWKFDQMGQVVSESWTLKEQRKFQSLMKGDPFSNEKSFWKLASNCFPYKRQKNLLSYYYNVFIPRRMSHMTRLSTDEVDSDEDQGLGEGLVDSDKDEVGNQDMELGVVD